MTDQEACQRMTTDDYTVIGFTQHAEEYGWTAHVATELEAYKMAFAYRGSKVQIDNRKNHEEGHPWAINVRKLTT